ncbi:COP9 signalosome (CSN) subunit [Lobaria immixta]|nr:COP9 signalosome (CSN) subunit [Lobaria immixta]
MDILFRDFREAQIRGSGPLLASTIKPVAPADNPNQLRAFYYGSNMFSIVSDIRSGILAHSNTDVRFLKPEGNAWADLYVAFWKAIGELLDAEGSTSKAGWVKVYESWKEVANVLIRGYSSAGFQAWTVPCLYVAGQYLRIFAIKADEGAKGSGQDVGFGTAGFQDDVVREFGKNERLEDAARVINRMFTLCISDRAPIEESRKWGLYYTTNLLFKTYFKLNKIGLSKNIILALQAAQTDMPPMDAFPKSHIVTFEYYVGVMSFLDDNYIRAEEHLTDALNLCHKDSHRNKELILTYLIPCHLLTTHTLPSTSLLRPYPRLLKLFTPLSTCIRRGDLSGFDAALAAGEDEMVKRRIYLTLERGRDIALRNLLRKVFLAGGFEEGKDGESIRRTRVPLEEFVAAVRLGSRGEVGRVESDEVECLLANMIYKNLMKGYISREKGFVVLSKSGAFPGTNV